MYRHLFTSCRVSGPRKADNLTLHVRQVPSCTRKGASLIGVTLADSDMMKRPFRFDNGVRWLRELSVILHQSTISSWFLFPDKLDEIRSVWPRDFQFSSNVVFQSELDTSPKEGCIVS